MTDHELLIRAAELTDVGAVMNLEQGSIIHPWTENDIKTLITDMNKRCIVADLDGEIVCYVGAESVLDECNIGNIVTAKEHRGNGYATTVLGVLLNLLRQNGVSKVFLEVEDGNEPAISLYKKHGFAQYGYRRDYYGQGKDAILMSKDL
jgi:ribosomal-protein-alanine N-acetyltransferase